MDQVHQSARILATTFSGIFALLLFGGTVGTYGVFPSLLFTLIGVSVIWGVYFLMGIFARQLPPSQSQRDRLRGHHGASS